MQDLMSDFIARINNANMVGKTSVEVIKNKLVTNSVNKLTKLGYFESFEVKDNSILVQIAPKLNKMSRISKTGRRVYVAYDKIPKLFGGKGFYLLTTSQGIITNIEANQEKLGGELLLSVF